MKQLSSYSARGSARPTSALRPALWLLAGLAAFGCGEAKEDPGGPGSNMRRDAGMDAAVTRPDAAANAGRGGTGGQAGTGTAGAAGDGSSGTSGGTGAGAGGAGTGGTGAGGMGGAVGLDGGELDASSEDDAGHPTCSAELCALLDTPCEQALCNENTDTCELVPRQNGTACGAAPDACQSSSCQQGVCTTTYAPLGAPCGDQGVECRINDACDGAGTCVDNGFATPGTPCGDPSASECDAPDSCNALGQCVPNYAPLNSACGDTGHPCRFDDKCNGEGTCIDNGVRDPSAAPLGYIVCGRGDISTCHPQADLCDDAGDCVSGSVPDGTPCGDDGASDCDAPDSCQAGFCVANFAPEGASCGDPSESQCDAKDSCDGAGHCRPNHVEQGTACTGPTGECYLPSSCDGAGACAPAYKPEGTACGSSQTTACSGPDQCDGAGTCDPKHVEAGVVCGDQSMQCHVLLCDGDGSCQLEAAPSGTPCGDPAVRACDDADSCDGEGNCDANLAAPGTTCGSSPGSCELEDTCDDMGVCRDRGFESGCVRTVAGVVVSTLDGEPLEGVVVEVLGGQPAMTVSDENGEFFIDAPLAVEFLLYLHPAPGHFGTITPFLVPKELVFYIQMLDEAEFGAELAAVEGLPPRDPSLGIVFSYFGGAAQGGESLMLSASSSPSVTSVEGQLTLSSVTDPDNPVLIFTNVAVGTTEATPIGAEGVTTCKRHIESITHWPVESNTITQLPITCSLVEP